VTLGPPRERREALLYVSAQSNALSRKIQKDVLVYMSIQAAQMPKLIVLSRGVRPPFSTLLFGVSATSSTMWHGPWLATLDIDAFDTQRLGVGVEPPASTKPSIWQAKPDIEEVSSGSGKWKLTCRRGFGVGPSSQTMGVGVSVFWNALLGVIVLQALFGVRALLGVADFFLTMPRGSGATVEEVFGVRVAVLVGVVRLKALRFSQANFADAFPMPAE